MSRSTKRKHVARELEEDLSVPTESQSIVQLIESRGNNLHEAMDATGDRFLISMPPKFRKSIWVKRGDFVIIEPILEGDKVKGEIFKILTREHIKFYQSQNCWPQEFEQKRHESNGDADNEEEEDSKDNEEKEEDDLFVNTNRPPVNHDTTETESDPSSEASDSD
ncbi:probable RNA-binding protein EIF1AD isoform X2 [Belonocnema kinseyi]|nr:probable RNA-binding protein EIF1AD isoform X2 [Belonocnema kinseyi]XP_033223122.1 probable RNA-binding protein EIF1AD isoform X2 [Belonocnema kinseyi]